MRAYLLVLPLVALAGCSTWKDQVRDAAQREDIVSACAIAAQHQDDPAAFYVLGLCSEDGRGGMPQDIRSAISYYTLAARYGVPQAQAQLARLGEPIPNADLASRQTGWAEAIGAGFQGMGSVATSSGALSVQPAPVTPLYTPPVQTNCQWIGNLWTCTSK